MYIVQFQEKLIRCWAQLDNTNCDRME